MRTGNVELTRAQNITVERVELCCRTCATRFAVDAQALESLKDQRIIPRCPFGHGFYLPASSIAGALRSEVENLLRAMGHQKRRIEDLVAQADSYQRRIAALIGVNKRLRARLERAG